LLRLGALAQDPEVPTIVLVTHHTEDIPPGCTHAALIRQGRLVAAGALEEVLTGEAVSECFGVQVRVGRDGARWWSRATP
jgi:iron complex transport system ATP-binding protein